MVERDLPKVDVVSSNLISRFSHFLPSQRLLQLNLLEQVAQGFSALYHDLQEQRDEPIIVTMSEFGRTSRENGSRDTDHGHACAMFVAGGRVQGGVYNCDPGLHRNCPGQPGRLRPLGFLSQAQAPSPRIVSSRETS